MQVRRNQFFQNNNKPKNDLVKLEDLIKKYINDDSEKMCLKLKSDIEKIVIKEFEENAPESLIEGKIDYLEKVNALISDANMTLVKLNKSKYLLRPSLQNLTFTSESPLPLKLNFNHWRITGCTFAINLTDTTWEDAQLINITFGQTSYYDLSELAKADVLEEITFENPKGHCENGGDDKLSNSMQISIMTIYQQIYLSKNQNGLLKEKLESLKERNNDLEEKVKLLENQISLLNVLREEESKKEVLQCRPF